MFQTLDDTLTRSATPTNLEEVLRAHCMFKILDDFDACQPHSDSCNSAACLSTPTGYLCECFDGHDIHSSALPFAVHGEFCASVHEARTSPRCEFSFDTTPTSPVEYAAGFGSDSALTQRSSPPEADVAQASAEGEYN